MKTAVLRINCRDVKGIVFNVSRFIYDRGGNIITAQQHCEELDRRFFMRVLFDMTDMELTRAELAAQLESELAGPFEMEAALTYPEVPRRMALMVSKYDHCLYDLLLRTITRTVSSAEAASTATTSAVASSGSRALR